MTAEILLSRLQKVKPRGKGQWLACCPAHEDKSPSMTVAEDADGRVLVHCFAGCGVAEILQAVSLDFSALFPPRATAHHVKGRGQFVGRAVLEALAFEATLAAVAAGMVARGEPINEADRARLFVAAERLQGAADHVRT